MGCGGGRCDRRRRPRLPGPSQAVLAIWSSVPSRPVGPRSGQSSVRDVALGSELTGVMQDPPSWVVPGRGVRGAL